MSKSTFIEFKEKTFESYFVSELSQIAHSYYSPDQTDERHLGFDAMFHIHRFRHWFSPHSLFEGTWLNGITPSEVNEMGSQFNRVYPNLKANLFLQFKRPQYLHSKRAQEWECWKMPYYRFNLYQHQHDILIDLAQCASGKARVVYASPKITSLNDLLDAAKSKKVIKKTQLVEAGKLTGHKKCTYSNNSNPPIGHSEPEVLSNFSLENFLEETSTIHGDTFTSSTKRVGSEINSAIEKRNGSKRILRLARSIISDGWTDEMPDEFKDSWLDHLITIHAFGRAFGIRTCLLS